MQELPALQLHSGLVKRPFPEVALQAGADTAVAVEIAEPLAMLCIGKMLVGPIMDHLMPSRVLRVARELVSEQSGDDRFILRPPELHVMPVLLDRQPVDINKVQDAAVFFVPASLPHPIEHLATDANEFVVLAQFAFVHDEPCTFDRVTWIEHAAIEMIDHFTWDTYESRDAPFKRDRSMMALENEVDIVF